MAFQLVLTDLIPVGPHAQVALAVSSRGAFLVADTHTKTAHGLFVVKPVIRLAVHRGLALLGGAEMASTRPMKYASEREGPSQFCSISKTFDSSARPDLLHLERCRVCHTCAPVRAVVNYASDGHPSGLRDLFKTEIETTSRATEDTALKVSTFEWAWQRVRQLSKAGRANQGP